MSIFYSILTGNEIYLSAIFGGDSISDNNNYQDNLTCIAKKLNTDREKITLALGFNTNISELEDIFTGIFPSQEKLIEERDKIYVNDVYQKISLQIILTLYNTVKSHEKMLPMMQDILKDRLKNIESKIEATVNSSIIGKYKVEMQTIYADKIADIDFAEARLSNSKSGFRALLNEVCMVAESRLIPIGDIFFRNTILPQEKRKLLNKKLIPLDLVKARLQDDAVSRQEIKVLNDFLESNRGNETGT